MVHLLLDNWVHILFTRNTFCVQLLINNKLVVHDEIWRALHPRHPLTVTVCRKVRIISRSWVGSGPTAAHVGMAQVIRKYLYIERQKMVVFEDNRVMWRSSGALQTRMRTSPSASYY